MGKDVVVQKVGDTILSNETVRGSLNMISINTKYPEKCLQFLDLVNTDTKMRDMFYYGEEGCRGMAEADYEMERGALSAYRVLIVPANNCYDKTIIPQGESFCRYHDGTVASYYVDGRGILPGHGAVWVSHIN